MVLELGEFVLQGEIINTEPYSVHGYLELRGCDRPLVFQLTGDCAEDLRGKHVRFAATRWTTRDAFEPGDHVEGPLLWQQIGPTGEVSVSRRSKVVPDSEGGESPKPCLYLEWFGQNGRVVVEVVDPLVEFVDLDLEEDDPGSTTLRPTLPEPQFGEPEPDVEPDDHADHPEDTDEDDPYGLFPDGLDAEFETSAAETDRMISGGSASDLQDAPDVGKEIELLDELMESGEGEPIAMIFEAPFRLRRPESLTEEEAEVELKKLLAQLALYNIAIDVCEHFSPGEVYEWLMNDILPKERAYPELRRTQWVQHFSTSDDCPECDAEFDELDEESDDTPF